MERALKLIVDESITIASIKDDRENNRKIKPVLRAHPGTGKESNHSFAFSQVTWGGVTRSWGKSALKHINTLNRIRKVIQEAKIFERAAFRQLPAGEMEDEDDERAMLSEAPNLSSDDEVRIHLFGHSWLKRFIISDTATHDFCLCPQKVIAAFPLNSIAQFNLGVVFD